ncbi:MAG: hypothetical protein ACYCWE_22195 [Eubacteriales bacterium]
MKSDMKTEVLNYIKKNGSTSFAELERFFDSTGFDWHGNLAITSNQNNTIFFWYGWNEAAVRITMDLVHDGLIFKEATRPLLYLIDGKCLNLPLAKSSIKYKKPHWLPIVFTAIKR